MLEMTSSPSIYIKANASSFLHLPEEAKARTTTVAGTTMNKIKFGTFIKHLTDTSS